MPEIQPSSVVSFSSEDKAFPASNLLTPSGFKKWKCEKPGEKSISVDFQLPKAEKISQIDIGNEGSAFIEVLVRRSSGPADDYQCLLVSSSFMSPLDARSRSGLNRVRIFKTDKLTRAVAEQKWDRVRVVCSQPFTRTEQYGLSFIRFYSTETSDSAPATGDAAAEKAKGTLAGFVIRDDDGEDSDEAAKDAPRLFAKAMGEKGKSKDDEADDERKAGPSSMASQIRAATKVAEEELKQSRKKEAAPKKRAEPVASSAKGKDSSADEDEAESSRPLPKRQRKDAPSAENAPKKEEKGTAKTSKKENDKDSGPTQMDSLMRGVEFALSGYQNPLRSRLRDMATGMGAKFRANWGPGCTHLICAFVATPKYKEVSGKGRIVTDKWILESHKRRRLLPWRDFRLGRAPSPPGTDDEGRPKKRTRPPPAAMRDSDDDDEDDDDEEEVLPRKTRVAPRQRPADRDDDSDASEESPDSDQELRRRKQARLKRKRGGDDSEDEWKPSRTDRQEESDSEPDAEVEEDDEDEEDEEEEEVMPKKKNRSKEAPARARPQASASVGKKRKKEDVSDSGDEEVAPKRAPAPKPPSPAKKKAAALLDSGSDSDGGGGWTPIRRKKGSSSSPEKRTAGAPKPRANDTDAKDKDEDEEDASRADLPSFLESNTFFMYGKFKAGMERCLRRIVVAYGGKLERYMTNSVKFVVTSSAWDDNFDDALMTNSSLLFVRPQWLLDCDQKRRMVPYQKYQVVD